MNTNSNITIEDKDRKEHAIKKLDLINSWLTNCDTKSSFILTLLSVFLTVIFTSDLGKKLLLPFSFKLAEKGSEGSIINFLLLLLSIAFFASILFAFYYIYLTLKARKNTDRFEESGLYVNSLMFFSTINKLTYLQYETASNAQSFEEVLKDINSQIYINSKVGERKFNNYNKSIKWMFLALILFIIFVILDQSR